MLQAASHFGPVTSLPPNFKTTVRRRSNPGSRCRQTFFRALVGGRFCRLLAINRSPDHPPTEVGMECSSCDSLKTRSKGGNKRLPHGSSDDMNFRFFETDPSAVLFGLARIIRGVSEKPIAHSDPPIIDCFEARDSRQNWGWSGVFLVAENAR